MPRPTRSASSKSCVHASPWASSQRPAVDVAAGVDRPGRQRRRRPATPVPHHGPVQTPRVVQHGDGEPDGQQPGPGRASRRRASRLAGSAAAVEPRTLGTGRRRLPGVRRLSCVATHAARHGPSRPASQANAASRPGGVARPPASVRRQNARPSCLLGRRRAPRSGRRRGSASGKIRTRSSGGSRSRKKRVSIRTGQQRERQVGIERAKTNVGSGGRRGSGGILDRAVSAWMYMRNGRCQLARARWAALRPHVTPSSSPSVGQARVVGACVGQRVEVRLGSSTR